MWREIEREGGGGGRGREDVRKGRGKERRNISGEEGDGRGS